MRIERITPFVMTADLDASIAFLEGLGFDCGFRGDDPGYAFMRCDAGAIRLLETDADLTDTRREQMVYLDVDDIDAFWSQRRAFIETLPPAQWRAPLDQAYGQREVHVIHGPTLFLFGQAIG
ncbi:VOC family protein [Jannaschia donghaensis]|uniref:Glyoxalase-like domain protein n=1 Tax=Jannaschia donghaensis TaxID=420998 RepID=A0A0M6YN84_9RHOB|nr:VOC family protein [Jannaschia donghaensis]CTQ51344.1 Glyoxalase-like domain protein [Jannaschia donghaensis]